MERTHQRNDWSDSDPQPPSGPGCPMLMMDNAINDIHRRVNHLAQFAQESSISAVTKIETLDRRVSKRHEAMNDLVVINEALYQDLMMLHQKQQKIIWLSATIVVLALWVLLKLYTS